MISDIVQTNKCCGCSACFHSCPTQAIQIKENSKGFFNAVVNVEKCVDCGICDKVCPVKKLDERTNIKCFAIKLHDNEALMKSQSGGAFFALAQKFLIQGGVVYGVSNVELKNVQTIRIDSIKDLELLLKSKYVQSNCIDSFPLVKEDLMSGRRVLYSGTACVVQGLKNYLEKKNVPLHSLFTCDLICHGVPSRLIDRDYQLYIENKCKKDIISITYRDKELGWGSHFEKYVLSNGKTIYRNDKVIVFSKGYALSPACFQCKYTNPYRVSDITIGDFWGLDRVGMSKKQFKHGISICIVRSSYIENIFLESTKNKDIELSEIELKDAMQWNLEQPTSMPKDYERFWMMYKKNRFKSLKPVYFSLSFKEKLSRMVKCIKNNIISKGKK